MTLVVTHQSALKFWVNVTTSVDDVTASSGIKNLQDATANIKIAKRYKQQDNRFGNGPFHVLVGPKNRRVSTNEVICHQTSGAFPPGSFRRIAKDALIVSPELCYLQMASVLSFLKLIELGWLLCGTYATLPDGELTNNRRPLTTKHRLAGYIERCAGMRGREQVAKALQFVQDNAASPIETKLALLLSLPRRLGGFRFPIPTMNHKVHFSPSEQQLYGRQFVVLDLYWPQWRIGIEYDGRAYHGESDAIARDRAKSSEMAARKIEILRVDRTQLHTPYGVYVLARKLGRISKAYVSKPTDAQWERINELYRTLLVQ